MTGSYCLAKNSYHIIFTHHFTSCAQVKSQNVRLQHERKRIDADELANSIFNNRVTVDASFQFGDVRDLGTIDSFLVNVKEVTDFQ